MKRSRFTEEQVVKVVKAVEGGLPIKDAVRQFGVSRATISIWRKKYAGMEVSDAKKLRALEDENRRLKRVVADLTLDKQMLQDALSRKW
jgi:putative transposase